MFDNREMGCVYDYKYCLASTGYGRDKEYVFGSRDKALKKMYQLIDKKGLRVTKIHEDNHDKTYYCDRGVSFYIGRAF